MKTMGDHISTIMVTMIMMTASMVMMLQGSEAADTNDVYSPCSDAKVQRLDGFTFGIAFSAKKENFFSDQIQLSPCDKRLLLAYKGAQFALFRPKVDEISLLTINTSTSESVAGYMVAFAGQKYAARSEPIMFADQTYTIISFILVLEFRAGTLENLHWKKSGCDKCSGGGALECLDNQNCAIQNSKCKTHGGPGDCNLSIQLVFSGTDKNLDALNSWYEVKNLQQNSLFGLFSKARDNLLHKVQSPF